MEYNSTREVLVIPEYGRHIQELINYAKTVEDSDKRQELAEGIVELMLQMNPTDKKTKEYVSKMWSHLLRISNYELDVKLPDNVEVAQQEKTMSPDKVDYPKVTKGYRHYGKYIQELLEKALAMPESPERDEFVRIIGSYMKTAYKQWNRDHFINDDSVLEDIKIMTEGKLSIADDTELDYLVPSTNNKNGSRKKTKPYKKDNKKRYNKNRRRK